MSDIWVSGVTTVIVLLVVIAVVWWWPDRIPRGRSVDEIRQRIEDEEDSEP
ncbi:hypothetical protein [Nocardia nova]|uniref:hypothetical protein n=1 Tax=Nocardia nova TaxID=37330 RepID=UPI000B16BFC6|nr:hypothetical protein [Nocardia nova]